jgi:ferredoxin--NADP+ reductase
LRRREAGHHADVALFAAPQHEAELMDAIAPATAATKVPPSFFAEKVTWVHHWTERLFSFRCTRDTAFRFTAGQFAMIGLMVEGKPLVRAYSVASAPWEEELEFLSIKVPNGPLTSRLQHIQVGDQVLIGRSPPARC